MSPPALRGRQEKRKLNNLEIEVLEHNVFDFLKHAKPDYDMIILDPPSFTRNKATLMDAMRGYKEIHLRSLKLLDKGGLLSTFCSLLPRLPRTVHGQSGGCLGGREKIRQTRDEPRPARGPSDIDFHSGDRAI